MIVTQISSSLPDCRQSLDIKVDGENRLSFWDGEPEDNNLGRNFSGCFCIVNLMEMAYKAGKNGENFVIREEERDES